MVKVTLDADTFKALASPTRLGVMRSLDERRKTVSELARDLDMNKATIHEHLQLLTASGLVDKVDEGRKWIYYKLTWRGERILHPQETTTFNLLLGVSVAAAGGGVAMLGRSLGWWLQEQASRIPEDAGDPGAERYLAQDAMDGNQTASPSGQGSAGSTETGTGTAPPGEGDQSLAAGTGPMPEDEDASAATDEGGFDLSDDGLLAVLLLAFSLLTTLLAVSLRRRLSSRPPRDDELPPDGSEPDEGKDL